MKKPKYVKDQKTNEEYIKVGSSIVTEHDYNKFYKKSK